VRLDTPACRTASSPALVDSSTCHCPTSTACWTPTRRFDRGFSTAVSVSAISTSGCSLCVSAAARSPGFARSEHWASTCTATVPMTGRSAARHPARNCRRLRTVVDAVVAPARRRGIDYADHTSPCKTTCYIVSCQSPRQFISVADKRHNGLPLLSFVNADQITGNADNRSCLLGRAVHKCRHIFELTRFCQLYPSHSTKCHTVRSVDVTPVACGKRKTRRRVWFVDIDIMRRQLDFACVYLRLCTAKHS